MNQGIEVERERASRDLLHAFIRFLRCIGVRSPFPASHVLIELANAEDGLAIEDIAVRTQFSYPKTYRIVDILFNKGILERAGSVKAVEGRGRARILYKINYDGLTRLIEECRKDLEKIEALRK